MVKPGDMRSLTALFSRALAEARTLPSRLSPRVTIGRGVRFGKGVKITASAYARVVIGNDVEIGAGTLIAADARGAVTVGDRVFISGLCIIASHESITIGDESMLAEMVCIRDHDHDPDEPPRSGVVIAQPVAIGKRVWLGSKSSVVRGGSVGDDSVVGAHALVSRPIPAGVVATGVPASVSRPRRLRQGHSK